MSLRTYRRRQNAGRDTKAMSIRIEGLEPLQARIEKLTKFKSTIAAIADAGKYIKKKARLYPPKPGRKQPFKTDKQRRFFFWALRNGSIQVPYRRTRTLKGGWNNVASNGGFRQIISNEVPYAPLVQGAGSQAQYHATTGWPTEEKIAQTEAPEVYRIIEKGIEQDLAG